MAEAAEWRAPLLDVYIQTAPYAFLQIEQSLTLCRVPYYPAHEGMCVDNIFDELRRRYGFSDLVWKTAQYVKGRNRQLFSSDDVEHTRLGEMTSGGCLSFQVRAKPNFEQEHKETVAQQNRERTLFAVPREVLKVFVDLALAQGNCCPITLEPFTRGERIAVTPCWHLFKMTALDEYDTSSFFQAPDTFKQICPVCRQPYQGYTSHEA